VGIGRLTLLNGDQGLAQPSSVRSHPAVSEPELNAGVHDRRDAGEDGCGPRESSLCSLRQVEDLIHRQYAFLHVVAEVGSEGQHGVTGDARQEGTVERRGHDPMVVEQEEVGGPRLLDLPRRGEKDLICTVLDPGSADDAERHRIVRAGLGSAELRCCARQVGLYRQAEPVTVRAEVLRDRAG
jgi:hypothetical protein